MVKMYFLIFAEKLNFLYAHRLNRLKFYTMRTMRTFFSRCINP